MVHKVPYVSLTLSSLLFGGGGGGVSENSYSIIASCYSIIVNRYCSWI